MKAFVWSLAGLGIAAWSAAAWAAFTLAHMAGDWAASTAAYADDGAQEIVVWMARVMAGLGEGVVILIWATMTLLIAGVAWFCTLMLDRTRMSRKQAG
ncbi:MAG: hypothetical protein GC201_10765 [Alphaproteobacteria bacterium]|nr:hypothetical protein [Alphaproteobacteria bacterium]